MTRQEVGTPAGPTTNVLAELAGSDPSRVLMVGGHLDSVDEGPGLNDNGSGTAAAIATAQALAAAVPEPAVTVRFAWWGGEELGLLGSQAYVDRLSADELGADHRVPQRRHARLAERRLLRLRRRRGPRAGAVRRAGGAGRPGCAGDAGPTGAATTPRSRPRACPSAGCSPAPRATKSEQEAQQWGGTAGEPYDPCYHASCDDLGNVDLGLLDTMADALAHAVWELAVPAAPARVDARLPRAS